MYKEELRKESCKESCKNGENRSEQGHTRGKGRTIEQYTKSAKDFHVKNSELGQEVVLKDGTKAIKIQTGTGKNKVGGYWTKDGKIVTFWD